MYRIPITLIFADGEVIVAGVFFTDAPTPEEVKKEAKTLARSRGAKGVRIPPNGFPQTQE